MAKTTIYTVKSSGSLGSLNTLENSLFEFITSKEFLSTVKVGDTLSEKQLKKQFAKWNNEKMTVNCSSLLNEKNCRNVCKYFASSIQSGSISSSVIGKVTVNQAHGNFAIDFVSSDTLNDEFTSKELEKKTSKVKTPLEFVMDYLSKEKNQNAIASDDTRADKINAIIDILNALKD